jgi:hypothetical protein
LASSERNAKFHEHQEQTSCTDSKSRKTEFAPLVLKMLSKGNEVNCALCQENQEKKKSQRFGQKIKIKAKRRENGKTKNLYKAIRPTRNPGALWIKSAVTRMEVLWVRQEATTSKVFAHSKQHVVVGPAVDPEARLRFGSSATNGGGGNGGLENLGLQSGFRLELLLCASFPRIFFGLCSSLSGLVLRRNARAALLRGGHRANALQVKNGSPKQVERTSVTLQLLTCYGNP